MNQSLGVKADCNERLKLQGVNKSKQEYLLHTANTIFRRMPYLNMIPTRHDRRNRYKVKEKDSYIVVQNGRLG